MTWLPWSSTTWQAITAALAAFVAIFSAFGAMKSSQEQSVEAKDTKGWLTGGDSYPYLYPTVVPGPNGHQYVSYFVAHAGSRYPLYDVQVRVQDLDNGPFLSDGSVIHTIGYRVGTLTGNTDKFPLGGNLQVQFPGQEGTTTRRLRIELPARNGLVIQDLTLTALGGRWVTKSTPVRRNGVVLTPPIVELK